MSFKTQAEIYQALLDGKKITGILLEEIDYLHLVDGFLKLNGNVGYTSYHFDKPEYWKIYEEPKKKKTVWQWRVRQGVSGWRVSEFLYTESEVREYVGAWEKHAGPFEVEE